MHRPAGSKSRPAALAAFGLAAALLVGCAGVDELREDQATARARTCVSMIERALGPSAPDIDAVDAARFAAVQDDRSEPGRPLEVFREICRPAESRGQLFERFLSLGRRSR